MTANNQQERQVDPSLFRQCEDSGHPPNGETCHCGHRAFSDSPQPVEQGERWTIYVCPDCGLRGEDCHDTTHIHAATEVEVVPASTLQAAEAERERLEATLLALLKGIGELTEVAQDSRYSDEFVGNLARSLLSPQEPTG